MSSVIFILFLSFITVQADNISIFRSDILPESGRQLLLFIPDAKPCEKQGSTEFKDGFFPYQGADIKIWFEALKRRTSPDVILCHSRNDAHQDHREVSMLTWNTFRDHAILEYEIPKWDGDLGQPNVFIPASRTLMERKAKLLYDHFGTQRSKDWFDAQTFMGLARLRGAECRAPDGFAEAFHGRKIVVQ